MITLKDIKISKDRIPVQNALWLRPVGEGKHEFYYPSGGNWKKITLGTSEDMDSSIEKRVEALEKGLKDVNVDISEIRKELQDFETQTIRNNTYTSNRILELSNRVTALEGTVNTILEMMESQMQTVMLPKSFDDAANNGYNYTRVQMNSLGFTELVFRSIYDGYCKKAYIENKEYDITYERNPYQEPGYGGDITITESDKSGDTYIEYKVLAEVETTSGSTEEKWTYQITKEEIVTPIDPLPEVPEED